MQDRPLIIGVSGRKRHGKNAVASILSEHFAFLPIAFADPIKTVLMDLYGFDYEQVYGGAKEVLDSRTDIIPRVAMQELGAIGRRIHPDTWVRKAFSIVFAAHREETIQLHSEARRTFLEVESSSGRWVIPDCRHENEAQEIRSVGGFVILVRRSNVNTGLYENHESETSVDKIVPDYIIENDGTLDDLRQKVFVMMSRLGINPSPTKLCAKCGQLKPKSDFNTHQQTADHLNSHCRKCARRSHRGWRERNREKNKGREREKHLLSTYGITQADYDQRLSEQGGGCALCGTPPGERSLCVDHDHTTGAIRGILCDKCNLAIERFDEVSGWAEKVVTYIERSG